MPTEYFDRCCPTDAPASTCVYDPTGDDFYMVGPLNSKAGIVVVSDLFGMLPNSKRLADMFAKEGYLAIMPDFFHERAWDHHKWPADFESKEWNDFITYARSYELHKPRMEHAIQVLRKLGVEKVGVMGMCWGSALAFECAADGTIDAVGAAHTFRLSAEAVSAAKTPVLLVQSKDEPPMEDVEAAVNAHPIEPHTWRRYDNLPHGFFGSRYDPDIYTAEANAEIVDARKVTLEFFDKTLR